MASKIEAKSAKTYNIIFRKLLPYLWAENKDWHLVRKDMGLTFEKPGPYLT